MPFEDTLSFRSDHGIANENFRRFSGPKDGSRLSSESLQLGLFELVSLLVHPVLLVSLNPLRNSYLTISHFGKSPGVRFIALRIPSILLNALYLRW
jgi:hypothetical protein